MHRVRTFGVTPMPQRLTILKSAEFGFLKERKLRDRNYYKYYKQAEVKSAEEERPDERCHTCVRFD